MQISLNNTSIVVDSMNSTMTNGTSMNRTTMLDIAENHSSRKDASLEGDSLVNVIILSMNLTLQNNETWERPVTYILNDTGDQQKLEFLLYREDNFTESYRDLHLWVNVTESVSYPAGSATNLTAA
jgi:hypothetical protein